MAAPLGHPCLVIPGVLQVPDDGDGLWGRVIVDAERIGLVIVPGVAFDIKNGRLGRGKGYYDRFLEKLPPGKTTIGLAFDFQIVKDLPKDSHDIPVSKVITD